VGPEPGFTNAAPEASLDLECSGAIARNATLVYVYANNFDDAVQSAVDQNFAPVMSESFGTCEQISAVANRSIAQQANAQGITFVALSMDSGPTACDPHGFFGSTGGAVASRWLSPPAIPKSRR
jgi:subtilase family serine protease